MHLIYEEKLLRDHTKELHKKIAHAQSLPLCAEKAKISSHL